jgi:coproporphyrinogen III oxidase-like Fe-S oxidoreductase
MLNASICTKSQEERFPTGGLAEMRAELNRRLRGPQRHRLLHGYPMAPLMMEHNPLFDDLCDEAFDPSRPLIVGVIPHTMCNPKVRGCGFCTFPHEAFRRGRAREIAVAIGAEIDRAAERWPALGRRRVDAIYFGGGTANLTPRDDLERHATRLRALFDLDDAECTLEGAPVYFGKPDLLDALPFRRLRISMGIQTFDPDRIEQMGRTHLGGRAHVERAIAMARSRNATTSGDLLINLPSQPLEAMLRDVDLAIDLGLDQICVYHLVLFRELGTPWASDEDMLAALPMNERAFANWAAVRERLLERGYVQRTLTNFERAAVPEHRQFIYERCSFAPETYDALGFGPAAISTLSSRYKWQNADTATTYLERGAVPSDRIFMYNGLDQRLLYITRKLPLLRIPLDGYRNEFGTELADDFAHEVAALEDAGLLLPSGELTPRGMFFADSIAGLFAWLRTRDRKFPRHLGAMSMMG